MITMASVCSGIGGAELADERGNLALEFLRLAERTGARWILWENVPGVLSSSGGRDFGAFLGGLAELGYGFAYRVLDAQFFGLAQRRKRVFVVGCLGDWRRAAAVLFEPACMRGDSAPRREARERVAASLTRGADSSGKGGYAGRRREDDVNLVAGSLGAHHGNIKAEHAWTDQLIARSLNAHPSRSDGESETFVASYRTSGNCGAWDTGDRVDALNTGTDPSSHLIAHSLRADGFDASEDGTGRGTPLVAFNNTGQGWWNSSDTASPIRNMDAGSGSKEATLVGTSAVRRLTPLEAERLQGFPDGHTAITYRGKPAADGPRYKALGNAFDVPVVRWIARRIAREHAATAQERAA